MSNFLNLNWLLGKGTRKRNHRLSALAIDSKTDMEHYKSEGSNNNVQVRRKPTSRSATALAHKPNKRTMALSARNEDFANIMIASVLRKTKKQRNQKRSRKQRRQRTHSRH